MSSIVNLVEGTYVVTVTDENNCIQIDSAEVIRFSCDDDYFDSGGANGEYSNNEDQTIVICSDSPNEDVVLTFNSFNIETNWDALYLYNGNSINSPIFDSGNPATQAGFPGKEPGDGHAEGQVLQEQVARLLDSAQGQVH